MRYVVILVVVLLTAVLIIGCAKKSKSVDNWGTQPTAAIKKTETSAKPEDKPVPSKETPIPEKIEAKPTGKYITTPSGLEYQDVRVGVGPTPKKGQIVVVDYIGTLENGKKFDSSYDRGTPFEFQIGVGKVIKGWDEGVGTMKAGGKRKLIIPANLGYGAANMGKIPPNSTLLFDVELHRIK